MANLNYVPSHSALFHPRPRAFNPLPLVIGLLVGIAIQISASYFYIWFYHEHNELVARVAACAGMSIGTWFLCMIVCEFGEANSGRIAAIVALFLALVGLYFSWMFWMQRTLVILANQNIPSWWLAIRPIPVSRMLWYFHDVGTWKHNGVVYRGWPLLAIWVCEAVILVVPPAFIASRMVTYRPPACQNCRRRVQRNGDVLKLSSRDIDDLNSALLDRRFDVLIQYQQTDQEREESFGPRILLKLYRCGHCADVHLLHAEAVSFIAPAKGQPKRVARPLVEYMVIGKEQADYINALGRSDDASETDSVEPADSDILDDPTTASDETSQSDPPALGM